MPRSPSADRSFSACTRTARLRVQAEKPDTSHGFGRYAPFVAIERRFREVFVTRLVVALTALRSLWRQRQCPAPKAPDSSETVYGFVPATHLFSPPKAGEPSVPGGPHFGDNSAARRPRFRHEVRIQATTKSTYTQHKPASFH